MYHQRLQFPVLATLATFAFVTLWLLMVYNGVLLALLKTAWSGKFPDGSSLQTTYTGILPLDFPLRILVAFFFGLQNLEQVAPFLLLVDLVAALLVINLATVVESQRVASAKDSKRAESSLIWQYAWNCIGVALCLPIWTLAFLRRVKRGRVDAKVTYYKAQALPYSAVFSLLLPLPLLGPALAGASARQIQSGFVLYLVTPALLGAFQAGAWRMIQRLSKEGHNPPKQTSTNSRPTTTAYMIVGLASAFIHLGILGFSVLSGNPSTTLSSLYMPDLSKVTRDQSDVLTTGALLFFQWDFIIIVFTVVVHNIFTSGCLAECGPGSAILVSSTLIAIGFVIGPGALLAYSMISLEYSDGTHGSLLSQQAVAT